MLGLLLSRDIGIVLLNMASRDALQVRMLFLFNILSYICIIFKKAIDLYVVKRAKLEVEIVIADEQETKVINIL